MPSLLHRLHEPFHRHHHEHHHRHAIGRHGHRGFGGRHGFGGNGPGIDDLHRGRKLGSADLQLLLLALLAERPSHGYELIKSLDERSNSYYSPSPGMVYPALTYLEEIGHASVEQQGAKKCYSITAEGLTFIEQQRAHVDALLEQLALFGQRMNEMRQAMSGHAPDEATDFDAPQGWHGHHGRGHNAGDTPAIRAARRSLKSALIEKIAAPASEQQRIAEILERAAAEIRGHGTPK